MKQIIIVFISFLFAFSVMGYDSQPTRYTKILVPNAVIFRGLVRNAPGKKISGAVIVIADDNFRREVRSNKKGRFELRIRPGTYQIVIEKPGYKKHVWEAYRIAGNAKTPQEFKVSFAQAPDVHPINP